MSQYFEYDESLKSEYRNIIYKYENYNFNFTSDLGVFSKDKIDFASRFLVETYFKYGKKNISCLDVGCGYGFIGITISKIMNNSFDMIDINKRAIHLTNMNIKSNNIEANAFISDIYNQVNKKYDLIITNPPIRAGKEVYMSILLNASNYLSDDGELWFVMNKKHGVKSTIEKLKSVYETDIKDKDKGFFVIICKKR